MKTADDFLKEEKVLFYDVMRDKVIKIINAAREDAIRECAEKAQLICDDANYSGGNLALKLSVDRESILSLIKELS